MWHATGFSRKIVLGVHTPTEIKSFDDLDKRISALEKGGGISGVSSVNGQTGAVTITAAGLGALTEDDLQSATNAALAQAKASGKFDGAQGPKGDTGAQGPQGPAGGTPVKGTDYWTASDQASIVQDTLAALPTWTGGSY